LLIAVAAVAFIALVVADLFTYTELRGFLFNQVDNSLSSAVVSLETALGSPPSGTPPDHDGDGPGGTGDAGGGPGGNPDNDVNFCTITAHTLAPGTYVAVRRSSGAIDGDACAAIESGGREFSPTLPRVVSGLSSNPAKVTAVYFSSPSPSARGPEFRVLVSRLMGGALGGDELVLAQPLSGTDSTLVRLLRIELAVTGGALVAAILLGWWLVRLGLAPLRRVEATAESISGGDIAHRVPGADPRTEVGRVALALNYMLEGIEQAFGERDETEAQLRSSEERLRRFVADASHELRTPVAAVSAYAELLDRFHNLPSADVTRIVGGIRGETSRMGALVGDLLLLARLDEGEPTLREEVELVDLVGGAIETARMVGPQWPVRLEATEAVEAVGDHNRLRQVLDNLLGNVRAHTPPGTATTVHVDRVEDEVRIEVADDGPGMTDEQAERVFERFYRADASRARTGGGAGLGLSIVASIVAAHGGTVTAHRNAAGGASFEVRLPSPVATDGTFDIDGAEPGPS
jgi:two-component system OmpR family sensor kinase